MYNFVKSTKISQWMEITFDLVASCPMPDKKYRYWNIRDNKEYVNRINNRKSYFESEKLTNTQKINEFIITRIRTMEGINNLELKNLNGICLFKEKDKEIKYLKDESLIDVKENRIVLTNRGKKIVDNIIEKISF